MEKLEIEAVYENGTLKLPHELPLRSGQTVTITVEIPESAGQRLRGLVQWKGSQEDLDHLLGPDNTSWAANDE
jgi:predicted DNA-binding antitoxin AbrB/MazE fold protein